MGGRLRSAEKTLVGKQKAIGSVVEGRGKTGLLPLVSPLTELEVASENREDSSRLLVSYRSMVASALAFAVEGD